MLNRILGVFKLNATTFEEIEHDTRATGQAFLIVLIVALLNAAGQGVLFSFGDRTATLSLISTLVWTLLSWLIWSVISYFVGTAFFGGKADMGEMLRVIGFAYSPLVLGIIPCIGPLIGMLWTLTAGFVAVRQGLDFDNVKALLTVFFGFAIYFIGWLIITTFSAVTGFSLFG